MLKSYVTARRNRYLNAHAARASVEIAELRGALENGAQWRELRAENARRAERAALRLVRSL